jgi:sodium/proline symporter
VISTDQATIGATFFVYIIVMLLIGWVAYRQTHNLSDYILGGRRLGRWVAAISAGASDMSGWLLLGLPGFAYAAGFQALWLVVGLLLGTYLNWRFIAQRLRIYSEQAGNALTLPAFFEERFNDRTRLLRIISAVFILLFFLFYTSSGLVAAGKLFETVFGLPYVWAVAGGAAAIILYTFMGGFLAVSWTDLVQGLLMAAALLIVPLMALGEIGGLNAALNGMHTTNPALLNAFNDVNAKALSSIAIVSLLGWGLGYFGQPHILARFKAIRSADEVGGARHIAVSWTALTLVGATLVGYTGITYVDPALQGADTEKVFMLLVSAMFHPVIAGILLAAILAAIMSTADSQLLVSSSALAEDFYKALFRKQAHQRELVTVGRFAVVMIAAIAFGLALNPKSKVLDLVAYAWAGFGAAFGPALILSLYWKRMTMQGALAGIITGGVTVVIWKNLSGGLFDLYEIVPGFVASVAAIVIVSYASPIPDVDIVTKHNAVSN